MVKLKLTVALALVLLVLVVVFQNTQPVETRFLFITFTMPRAALLAITFLVGAAAGILLSFGLAKRMPRKDRIHDHE
jgi:uncharacterized integral membrane protein